MIIPPDGLPLAAALLATMLRLKHTNEEQRRFIGTLRKAQGMVSNNERKRKPR